jgi:hypothetical protein
MVQRIASAFDLRFKDRREWKPVPVWTKFFISLGAALSVARSPKIRIVAALSVPTPSFAAAFIALGRILGEPISEPSKSALDAHFDKLAALSRQTPLIYFNDQALYNGPFLGTLKHSGGDFIRMAIQGGTCMIPKHRCLLVEVQPESQTGKAVTHVGRLRNPKPFVGHFFSLVEHYRILCSTSKSVIIIGERNRLRNELVQTPFAIANGTGCVEGVLQDLIRIAKFSSGGVGCRADVYSRSRGHTIQNGSPNAESLLTVLDGAVSYLRWAHEYPDYDTIAILSRTDSEYGTAIDSANARYLTRADDYSLAGLISPPPGIELMVHVETRQ